MPRYLAISHFGSCSQAVLYHSYSRFMGFKIKLNMKMSKWGLGHKKVTFIFQLSLQFRRPTANFAKKSIILSNRRELQTITKNHSESQRTSKNCKESQRIAKFIKNRRIEMNRRELMRIKMNQNESKRIEKNQNESKRVKMNRRERIKMNPR